MRKEGTDETSTVSLQSFLGFLSFLPFSLTSDKFHPLYAINPCFFLLFIEFLLQIFLLPKYSSSSFFFCCVTNAFQQLSVLAVQSRYFVVRALFGHSRLVSIFISLSGSNRSLSSNPYLTHSLNLLLAPPPPSPLGRPLYFLRFPFSRVTFPFCNYNYHFNHGSATTFICIASRCQTTVLVDYLVDSSLSDSNRLLVMLEVRR